MLATMTLTTTTTTRGTSSVADGKHISPFRLYQSVKDIRVTRPNGIDQG
jgi:hypothetical protein